MGRKQGRLILFNFDGQGMQQSRELLGALILLAKGRKQGHLF
jgi:hypothetical protein